MPWQDSRAQLAAKGDRRPSGRWSEMEPLAPLRRANIAAVGGAAAQLFSAVRQLFKLATASCAAANCLLRGCVVINGPLPGHIQCRRWC